MVAPLHSQMPVLKELVCPNCGTPLQQRLAGAQAVVCPACQTHVNLTTEQPEILSEGVKLPPPPIPIHLGDRPTFNGEEYFVMGRIVYRGWDAQEPSDRWHWTEWLLGGASGQMLWMSYDDEAGLVMYRKLRIKAPFQPMTDRMIPIDGERQFPVAERYPARILGAEGELTWQAKRGDDVYMVEGSLGEKRYSVQHTPAELEMYEGITLDPKMIDAAFGHSNISKVITEKTTVQYGIMPIVGFLALFIAMISCCMGLVMGGTSGDLVTSRTVQLSAGNPVATFPVEIKNANRPATIKVSSGNLPLNTYAVIDVNVTKPDEEDLYITSQEFWHETGTDEDGRWEESDYDGEAQFLPPSAGTYMIEVVLDQDGADNVNVKVEVYEGGFYGTPMYGYGICVGLFAVVILYFTLYRPNAHLWNDED